MGRAAEGVGPYAAHIGLPLHSGDRRAADSRPYGGDGTGVGTSIARPSVFLDPSLGGRPTNGRPYDGRRDTMAAPERGGVAAACGGDGGVFPGRREKRLAKGIFHVIIILEINLTQRF